MTVTASPGKSTRRSAHYKRNRVIAALFLAVVALVIVLVVVSGGSSGTGYNASVEGVLATSPKNLAVVVHVKNTSSGPVTPDCVIQAIAATGATATTAFTATHPLAAGTQGAYHLTLTVTHTAATKVTKSEVKLTCH